MSPLDGQDSEDDGLVDFAALFKRGLDNLRVAIQESNPS